MNKELKQITEYFENEFSNSKSSNSNKTNSEKNQSDYQIKRKNEFNTDASSHEINSQTFSQSYSISKKTDSNDKITQSNENNYQIEKPKYINTDIKLEEKTVQYSSNNNSGGSVFLKLESGYQRIKSPNENFNIFEIIDSINYNLDEKNQNQEEKIQLRTFLFGLQAVIRVIMNGNDNNQVEKFNIFDESLVPILGSDGEDENQRYDYLAANRLEVLLFPGRSIKVEERYLIEHALYMGTEQTKNSSEFENRKINHEDFAFTGKGAVLTCSGQFEEGEEQYYEVHNPVYVDENGINQRISRDFTIFFYIPNKILAQILKSISNSYQNDVEKSRIEDVIRKWMKRNNIDFDELVIDVADVVCGIEVIKQIDLHKKPVSLK